MTDQNNEQTETLIRPPMDFFDARAEAFDAANWECTVKKDNCTTKAKVAHQKKLIIGDLRTGYQRKIEGVMQTADNLVVCCPSCHSWIHNNTVEATALGYLDRS
jgi:hypothetical protein